jgi:hypothetical protein
MAVFALLTAPASAAEAFLNEVANALKESPVYVSPDTENIESNTAADLQAILTSEDNVFLVMLPAAAEKDVGEDLPLFASQLAGELGEHSILGIAVGDKAVAYAASMPSGVAPDLMHRAQSVSNSPVTTLRTFVRNVHQWQKDHPEAKTTGKPSEPGASWWPIPLVAAAVFLMGGVLFGRYKRSRTGEERTHFKAPDQVRELLGKIAETRQRVRNPYLRNTLSQCCSDIEKYFQRYSSNKQKDAALFKNHLVSVLSVLNKYVEVQDNQRYYHHPDEVMRRAEESVGDFAEYVLQSIRSGNEAGLLDYQVDTNILAAKRYA